MADFRMETYTADWNPNATVVRLNGFIDAHTASKFKEQALQIVQGGRTRLLFDCANLEFISSAGLGVLVVLLGMVEKKGSLGLMNLKDNVYKPFKLLGFTELFRIYKSAEEARHATS